MATAATVFRDYETDGVPASGSHKVKKSDVRQLLGEYENIINAFLSTGGLIFPSKSALDADLAHAANSMAWVIGDATVANNGIYRKIGASGTGSWTRVADLPFSFIIASDAGAGTPNAIQATTSIPVSSSALVWMNVFEANTASPVTVSFNGGAALTIKTNSGNDVAVGGLTAGMIVMGIVSGSTFRLVSDQASSAVLAAAEAAKDAAEAAQAAAEAAAAGVDLPPVSPNRMLVDNAAGTVRESKTFEEVRALLDISGKYIPDIDAPYVSLERNLKGMGLRPEWFDKTNAIELGLDAGPAIRAMFAFGIANNINLYRFAAGKTYIIDSFDPTDATQCNGVRIEGFTNNITVEAWGSVIKGKAGIQGLAGAGAMVRLYGSGVPSRQRIIWNGGELDMAELPSASVLGTTTIGGLAFGGSLNITCRGILFNHGVASASGESIGTGGGDQSVFGTSYESLLLDGCMFVGAPDLGVYLSSSGSQEARIVNCLFYRCQNGIAQKRRSAGALVDNCRFIECGVGIYNPVADGLDNNHGGAFYISDCIFERIQITPIDLGGQVAGGSTVQDCKFRGWGRKVSDGGELAASGIKFAVRLRVPGCIVSGCIFDMNGFAAGGTTAGKEAIGVEFNFSGGTVSTGANDCQSYGNTFKDVYRAHNMGANTSGIRRFKNRRINVSQPDLDGGNNILPYVMTDDTMVTITPPNNRNIVRIKSNQLANGHPNGLVSINVTGVPSAAAVALERTTNILFSSSVSSVAGATDGNFTIAVGVNVLYLINRMATTISLDVEWDQE